MRESREIEKNAIVLQRIAFLPSADEMNEIVCVESSASFPNTQIFPWGQKRLICAKSVHVQAWSESTLLRGTTKGK